jgi:hypothetical protein
MNLAKSIFKELLSLFVDDGNLAIQSLALVLVVAVLVKGFGLEPLVGAGLLLAGCLVILTFSLRRKLRG